MKEVARFRKQYHKEKEQKETERQDAMKRLKVTTKRKHDSGPIILFYFIDWKLSYTQLGC